MDFDYTQYEYPDGRGCIRSTAKQELIDRCERCKLLGEKNVKG